MCESRAFKGWHRGDGESENAINPTMVDGSKNTRRFPVYGNDERRSPLEKVHEMGAKKENAAFSPCYLPWKIMLELERLIMLKLRRGMYIVNYSYNIIGIIWRFRPNITTVELIKLLLSATHVILLPS